MARVRATVKMYDMNLIKRVWIYSIMCSLTTCHCHSPIFGNPILLHTLVEGCINIPAFTIKTYTLLGKCTYFLYIRHLNSMLQPPLFHKRRRFSQTDIKVFMRNSHEEFANPLTFNMIPINL